MSFTSGEQVEDLSPTGFSDRVERVGSRGRSRHAEIIYPNGNISRGESGGSIGVFFLPAILSNPTWDTMNGVGALSNAG
jgi:hypothetical protein